MKQKEVQELVDKVWELDQGGLLEVLHAVTWRWAQIAPEMELRSTVLPRTDPQEQQQVREFAQHMRQKAGEERSKKQGRHFCAQLKN